MATITGLTAARMLAIEAASVVDGDVVGDNLVLTRQDGSTINAGSVRGAQGVAGPAGSDLVVVTARDILEVGVPNQIRAGRQLSAADFTNLGLSAPAGLWNLSNVNDSSGNGRNLTNKGTVPFTKGINGLATTAAQFAGSSAQALYIADVGAADSFRIKTGSWGCWFRTAKTGTTQALMGKYPVAEGQNSWWAQILTTDTLQLGFSTNGLNSGNVGLNGFVKVCDDRWHFVVCVVDGTAAYLYVDGTLDKMIAVTGPIFQGSQALNIGSLQATAAQASFTPHFGRIDEAFVTADVLNEEQIRNLYCAKISHALGGTPKRVSLNVRRRKKGAALATTDFPATPLRLYNFSAGALTDQGSNAATLTAAGSPITVLGADGSAGNAYNLDGAGTQILSATDAGLPSGVASRSYGLWLKFTPVTGNRAVMGWGASSSSTAAQAIWVDANGALYARNIDNTIGGIYAGDSQWHFVVVTEENAPIDGLKRKMYVDGLLVGATASLTSFALAGANRFRIGIWPDGVGSSFRGQVDGVFVYNGVLDAAEIAVLYAKGSQSLGISPKNPGDHVELMTSSDLYCAFPMESQHQVDLAVA